MRSIPQTLKDRTRSLQQTFDNNSDPRLNAIISRHSTVLLKDFDMWQRVNVPGAAPSRNCVALSRPMIGNPPDYAYVGVIRSGTATIYRGEMNGTKPPATFEQADSVEDATDIAIVFESVMQTAGTVTDAYTVGNPWLIWVTATGAVQARQIETGAVAITLAGSGVSRIAAAMGAMSLDGWYGQGLVLAYITTGGTVYTRQYIGGGWDTARIAAGTPTSVTDIAVTRTWDFRVVLMLKTGDGKVYHMIGDPLPSGGEESFQIVTGNNDSVVDGSGNEILCNVHAGTAFGYTG